MKTYFYIAFGLILWACHPCGGGFPTKAILKADQVHQTALLPGVYNVLEIVRMAVFLTFCAAIGSDPRTDRSTAVRILHSMSTFLG